MLTSDQWDTYKLDPDYDCLVRVTPQLSIVTGASTRKPLSSNLMESLATASDPKPASFKRHLFKKKPFLKSRAASLPIDVDSEYANSDAPNASGDEDADEDEVKRMVDDGKFIKQKADASQRLKKVRTNIEEARRLRRQYNAKRREKLLAEGIQEDEIPTGNHDEDEEMMSLPTTPVKPSKTTRAKTVDPGTSCSRKNGKSQSTCVILFMLLIVLPNSKIGG